MQSLSLEGAGNAAAGLRRAMRGPRPHRLAPLASVFCISIRLMLGSRVPMDSSCLAAGLDSDSPTQAVRLSPVLFLAVVAEPSRRLAPVGGERGAPSLEIPWLHQCRRYQRTQSKRSPRMGRQKTDSSEIGTPLLTYKARSSSSDAPRLWGSAAARSFGASSLVSARRRRRPMVPSRSSRRAGKGHRLSSANDARTKAFMGANRPHWRLLLCLLTTGSPAAEMDNARRTGSGRMGKRPRVLARALPNEVGGGKTNEERKRG